MALLSFKAFTESSSTEEALSISQRLARKRQMRRLAPKIKIGRERAKRRMADKGRLEKRAQKQARMKLFKKFSKGKGKNDLSFQRRQDIEKRLNSPNVKKRIKMIAKRMFKDVRKKELERKRGSSKK